MDQAVTTRNSKCRLYFRPIIGDLYSLFYNRLHMLFLLAYRHLRLTWVWPYPFCFTQSSFVSDSCLLLCFSVWVPPSLFRSLHLHPQPRLARQEQLDLSHRESVQGWGGDSAQQGGRRVLYRDVIGCCLMSIKSCCLLSCFFCLFPLRIQEGIVLD